MALCLYMYRSRHPATDLTQVDIEIEFTFETSNHPEEFLRKTCSQTIAKL